MSIFNFFTDQVLGMKWLSDLTTLLVENVFNLDITSKLGGSIQFFIYDTIKIFIRCFNIFNIIYSKLLPP